MIDTDADQLVAALNRLLDLVVNVFSGRCLRTDADYGSRSVLERFVNQLLDRCVALPLGFLPKRGVMPSRRCGTVDRIAIANNVSSPDVALVMEAEKYSPSHESLLHYRTRMELTSRL